MEIFRLFGSVMIEDQAALNSLSRIDQQAQSSGNRLSILGKIGGALGKAVVVGATAAVGGLSILGGLIAKTGIAYNAMSEQSAVAWKTLLGTQEEAKTMLEDIGKFAKTTQFETAQVDAMAKYMHNAGLEGQGLFDALTKVADVSGAFNIPAAEAQELTRQMSQVRQAGIAYTEDLNVLADRGVPIYKAISEQLGITVGDVKKMASDGKLSSEIYLQAFDNIAKGVAGASAEQSKTFTGMLSTLKDNLNMISGELTKGAFEFLKSTLETIMPILERFSTTLKDEGLRAALSELFGEDKVNKAITLFTTIRDVGVTAFNLLKDTIKFVSDNLNIFIPIAAGAVTGITAFKIISTITMLTNLWRNSILLTTIAQQGLNTALRANPIGLVITAIGLLVAAGVALYMNWDTVKEKTRQLWDKLGAFSGVATAILGPIGFIIRAAVTMAEQWDSTKSIWENVWNGIKIAASNSVNDVIGSINKLIGMINKIPGVNIPIIAKVDWGQTIHPSTKGKAQTGSGTGRGPQRYAKGTNFHPGGSAIVGEEGPELITDLPRGAKVHTASATSKMMGNTFNFDGMMNGAVFNVREEADIQKIAKALHDYMRQAARGKGVVMG